MNKVLRPFNQEPTGGTTISMVKIITLPDLPATADLGAMLAGMAQPGDVIALWGDLGAGKTELARSFIRAELGPDEEVPSPTFTLVQTYDFPKAMVWHFDLYRLESPDDVFELDMEEAMATGICLIEWPERMGPYLPAKRLDVQLSLDGEARQAELIGWEDRLA